MGQTRPGSTGADPQAIDSQTRGLLEQQWCEIAEVPPPDPPVVRAFRFQERVLDPRLLERVVQGLRALHRGVVLTARDPQEIDLLVGLGRIGGECRPAARVSGPPAIPALMMPT